MSNALYNAVAGSAILAIAAFGQIAASQEEPPNILVIMTDNVGLSNVGAYHQGLMSSRTPNIDSLAIRRYAGQFLLGTGR